MTTIEASPTVYVDCARAVLVAAQQGLTDSSVAAVDRSYVEPGIDAAYDVLSLGKTQCEALVVAAARPAIFGVSRPHPSGQDGRATRGQKPNPLSASWIVHAVVCYPAADRSGPPKADAILSAAERVWSVAFAARRGVEAAISGGTLDNLFPNGDPRATRVGFGEVGPLNPYGPSGGVVAATFSVSLRI